MGLLGPLRGEAVGIVLLALGLFFSAAFVSGRGAFLGDAGAFVVTGLLGLPGLALAPVAAVCGLLLLVGRLPGTGSSGERPFCCSPVRPPSRPPFRAGCSSPRDATPRPGAFWAAALYWAVHWAGGAIGAALVIGLLYAVGLSLLTGVSFAAGLGALKKVGVEVGRPWSDGFWVELRERKEKRARAEGRRQPAPRRRG